MQLNFNAANHEPNKPLDPIPSDWYDAMIDESEMKPTSAGNGQYLQLRFNILSGQFSGRKVFTRLNLINPNQTAVNIAYGDLSAICRAIGRMQIQDSAELHGQPMKIKVKLVPARGDYDASNEIKGYENINAQVGTGTPAGGMGASGMAAPQGGMAAPMAAPMGQPAGMQANTQQAPTQQAPMQQTAPQGGMQGGMPGGMQGGMPGGMPGGMQANTQAPMQQTAPQGQPTGMQQTAPQQTAPAQQQAPLQPWQQATAQQQAPAQQDPAANTGTPSWVQQ